MIHPNPFQVFAWAAVDFFDDAKFIVADESEETFSFEFEHRHTGETFQLEISENETEISLTAKIRQVIRRFFPNDKIAMLSDWRMLLERFRLLDGTEDQRQENDEETACAA